VSFAERIQAARNFDARRFLPFHVAGVHCGWVRPEFARHLQRWPAVFIVTGKEVALAVAHDSPATRSAVVAPILLTLREEGLITGWRDETYPVAADFGEPPLLNIERAASRVFGIRTRGAHLNGTVGRGTDCRMWIARRAATKSIDPSLLDNLVGGGVGFGFSPEQTIVKECGEEAGIPEALAQRVQAKSTVTLKREVPEGLQWETLYTFDLELDADFKPENRDGEVAGFQLLPIREVRRLVRDSTEFTVDAALVVIDFLLRHDSSATATAEHAALVAALRGTPPAQP
jgi:8-oxo-dGTP pyrophosphatase MutT (NUDIX family)